MAAPAFGRPVAPDWAGARAPSPNSHGSAAFSFSMSLSWSGGEGVGRLDVADARELKLEPYALFVALLRLVLQAIHDPSFQ